MTMLADTYNKISIFT